MAKSKPSYVPAPAVPPGMAQRVETILEVMAGRMSVAQGARTLGMSRNHFQTILHRGLTALVTAVTPGEGGRPPKPKEVSGLEQENASLRRENARLREAAETSERFLQAASGLLQGRLRPARQGRQRKRPRASDDEGSESEPRRARAMQSIEHMKGSVSARPRRRACWACIRPRRAAGDVARTSPAALSCANVRCLRRRSNAQPRSSAASRGRSVRKPCATACRSSLAGRRRA